MRSLAPIPIVVLFLVLSLICCAPALPPGTGSIAFDFVSAESPRVTPATLYPDIAVEVVEYTVLGTGPAEATFDVVIGPGGGVVEAIPVGSWEVSAVGRNDVGDPITQGAATIEVSESVSEVSLTMSLAPGIGTCAVSVVVAEHAAPDHSLAVTAVDAEGTAHELAVASPAVGTFGATADLPTGIYLIEVVLTDGEGSRVAGAVSAAYIVADRTTSGVVELSGPPPLLVDLTCSASANTCTPLPFTLEASHRSPVFVGTDLELTRLFDAPTAVPSEGVTTVWYHDGVGTGEETASIIRRLDDPGRYRVDAVVTVDGFPVSSGGVTVEVIDPVRYGPFAFRGHHADNELGVDGLSGVRDCAVHPAGLAVYCAGYGESSIAVFTIDPVSGDASYLTRVRSTPECSLSDVSAVAVSPDGSFLAAVTSGTDVLIIPIQPDAVPDVAEAVVVSADDGSGIPADGLVDLVVHPDGELLLAAAHDTSQVVVLRSTGDGSGLSFEVAEVYSLTGSPSFSDTLEPVSIAVSPGGAFAAVSGETSDSVALFSVDGVEGTLTQVAVFEDGVEGVDGLNGGGGLAFASAGTDLYAVGYYDSAVVRFSHDAGNGWGFAECLSDGTAGISGLHYPRDITVTSDDEYLLVAASGDDSFLVFDRDAGGGSPAFLEAALQGTDRIAGLDGARSVEVDPVTGSAFVAASNDDSLAVFVR